ncbi:MAG TPA: class I SAM-dependent methyltransferase [Candidatus Limnocylindrales bacterium]|nr:class I SAM-dependent methyltransferase [Candidatus Limnocylindrales bacterium]
MEDETKASKTAIGALALRALHQTVDPEPVYEDDVAVRLYAGVALGPAANRFDEDPAGSEALRKHIAQRTVFAEERLRRAVLERGVGQYLVLGAGYDTFAYRQPEWARGLRIVEIDQPATQHAKREALRLGGITVPGNVRFAAVDFERTPLREGLAQAGIDLEKPVFFSWLGVTMYLTREAVEQTLATVARLAGGTEIAFTFTRLGRSAALGDRAAAAGEPWLTGFEDDELSSLLHAVGFGTIEIDGPCAAAVVP